MGSALDLGTGVRASAAGTSRAADAWQRASGRPCELAVVVWPAATGGRPALVRNRQTLIVNAGDAEWRPFAPTRDGQPLFPDDRMAGISRAVLAGDLLAFQRGEAKHGEHLHLYRGPKGVAAHTLSLGGRRGRFAVSADGARVGVFDGVTGGLALRDADDAAAARNAAPRAKLHAGLAVRAEHDRVTVQVGGFRHTFRLAGRLLAHDLAPAAATIGKPEGNPEGYDPHRFRRVPAVPSFRWQVWVDLLGQVVLTDAGLTPQVAFLVRRDRAAAWAAGGHFWGDAALTGGPPTPDAAAHIGRALAGGEA